MREIKFRAWDNVKEQMYFVGEEEDVAFEIVGGKFVGYDAREEFDAPCFKMEHLEVMQYTGLKDKNGVEIYEGDIIKGLHDFGPGGMVERIAEVHFHETQGYQWNYWDLETIQVVGNIYEKLEEPL